MTPDEEMALRLAVVELRRMLDRRNDMLQEVSDELASWRGVAYAWQSRAIPYLTDVEREVFLTLTEWQEPMSEVDGAHHTVECFDAARLV